MSFIGLLQGLDQLHGDDHAGPQLARPHPRQLQHVDPDADEGEEEGAGHDQPGAHLVLDILDQTLLDVVHLVIGFH